MYPLIHRAYTARGWTFEGERPDASKFLAIGAPHTSNWDFFAFMAAMAHFDLKANVLIKESAFVGPLGSFLRSVGGIPVDRSGGKGLVNRTVEAFDRAKDMILVLAPEGTRSKADHWKTGFHRIARAADVPLLPAWVDYPSRRIGFEPLMEVTADIRADMAKLKEIYGPRIGRHPEMMKPIRLAEA